MRNLIQKIKITDVIILLVILLGAYLRLYKISEYMTFLGDEGRDMLVVLHMIVNHKWTLLGPTASVGGFFLGPIYYYFMLPFVWLFQLDPSGAAIMVALFGIATIYVVYRCGRDMFDEWVGLIAATLYAVSPLVIAYSRSSWNPNLVPFFATSLIYLLWRSVVRDCPKLLFWIGVILGIGLQLHYLFLFLFAVVGVWYLLYGRNMKWLPYYALGVAGFVVGYAPFLAFEIRHGFPNTLSIIRFLQEGKDTGFVFVKFTEILSDVSYRLFGRLVFRLPPPEQLVQMKDFRQWLWPLGTKLSIVISVIVSILAILQLIPVPWKTMGKDMRRWKTAIVLFLVWFVVPLMLFGLYKKGIYDYYFGLFYALPFFMVALVLRLIAVKPFGKWIAVAALSALVYLNWQGRPFLFTPNNQLNQARSIAEAALSKTDGKPFNFALITGGNSDHAYRFFFERWGRAPVTIENTVIDPDRKTVTDQLIVICELADCKPLGNSLWEVAGFGRAEIEGKWNISFVTIYKLGHYKGPVL
jgi:4-amino-4-deoxy-L-arabinose transferase-like glycosyltransferase